MTTEIDIRLAGVTELTHRNRINKWEMLRYDGTPIDVSMHAVWRPYASGREITLTVGATYRTVRNMLRRTLLDYSIEVRFELAESADLIDPLSGEPAIPPALAAMMLSVAVGSLRGMLALRTAGTFLMRHPLPIINISDMISRMTYSTEPSNATRPVSQLHYG